VLRHPLQHRDKRRERRGRWKAIAAVLTQDDCHALKAQLIERLKDVQRGKEERARATRRIEGGQPFDALPEGQQQRRIIGGGDSGFGESQQIDIPGYEIVDGGDVAAREFGVQLRIALTSANHLAPDLGR
jgi:hypothetical protein